MGPKRQGTSNLFWVEFTTNTIDMIIKNEEWYKTKFIEKDNF